MGTGDRGRLEPRQRPRAGTLTSTQNIPATKEGTAGPVEPRQPGPPAGLLSYPDPKIKIH